MNIPPKVQHYPTSGLLIGWNMIIKSKANTYSKRITTKDDPFNIMTEFEYGTQSICTEIHLYPIFKD